MDYTTIIITLIGTLFGGGLASFVTIRTQKKKAAVEVESTELDNVEKAITIWREMAVDLRNELETQRSKYAEITEHVDALRREVKRLTDTSKRILLLLDQITPDNLDKMKKQIQNELNEKHD